MSSLTFSTLPKWNQKVILMQMSTTNLVEVVTFEVVVSNAPSP